LGIDRKNGVRVVAVGELLGEDDLSIPPYQRPYSWEPVTAVQMLDDIRDASQQDEERAAEGADDSPGTSTYILGAVILHRDQQSGQSQVVDGQQRLLTLTMLLDLLDDPSADGSSTGAVAEDVDHSAPVVRVRSALARRLRHLDGHPEALADFIRSRCQVIRVETDDADEAFRVFDSQNYRGKALLPHDLLKAYHLREMPGETDSMKAALVEGWEAVPDDELDRLFSTYLWRIKRWSRGLPAPRFSVRHIDAFKGVNARTASTPVARYHLAAQAAVPLLSAWSEQPGPVSRDAGRTRFQIDAPVSSGRGFFEMVTFMLGELAQLRKDGYHEAGWDRFASTDAELHEIPSRARYRYVGELYLAALLYYTNKFGDSDVSEAQDRLFAWAYGLRTRLQRVQMASVNNHATSVQNDRSAFILIRDAEQGSQIRRLVVDVQGREQDGEHETGLLALLQGLVAS
jgi:hypothetical protein